MVANNGESAISENDIQTLLDMFMEADEEESQHMLNEQGHILLSDNALQLIRDQITELSTIVLPTLEKKLQFLEETKRLRAEAERLRPKQDVLASPFALKALLGQLSGTSDPRSFIPDWAATAAIMKDVPPETIFQSYQQFLSSPEETDRIFEFIWKTQNLSDDQAKKQRDKLRASLQGIKGIDSGLLKYILQKIWELPAEKRESFFRGDQPTETLMALTADIQAYINEHDLDISAMMKPQPLQASPEPVKMNTNSVQPSPEKPVQSEQIPIPPVVDSSTQETVPLMSSKVPQIEDQNAFLDFLVRELQKAGQTGERYQFPISPDLFDSFDTTNYPRMKYAQLLYRVLFLVQQSEGQHLEKIAEARDILDGLMKTDAPTMIPILSYLYELLHSLSPTENEDAKKKSQQNIPEDPVQLTGEEDPVTRAIALFLSIARGALSSKPEEIEQAIEDCGEIIEIFERSDMAVLKARACMLRGAARTELATRNPNKQLMIKQAFADLDEALTFFTKESTPDGWAEILLNRSILYHMYTNGDPVQNRENALEDSLAALTVLSPEKTPLRWALAHSNCGRAYAARIHIQLGDNVRKAQEHYDKALKVFTPENDPRGWAETLIARGRLTCAMPGSLSESRELRPGFFKRGDPFGTLQHMVQDIENALADFTRVLNVVTKQSDPYNWADAHYERAFARTILAQNDRKQHLRAILEDYDAALEVFTYEEYPSNWAAIQLKIAITFERYIAESHEEDSLRALKHLDAALLCYTRTGSPLDYHRVQEVRAIMYERLGRWEEARAALMEARAVQRELLATTRSSHLLHIIAEFVRPEISLRHAQIALRLNPPDYEEAVKALEEGRTQAMRHLLTNFDQQELANSGPPLQVPELSDITSCITNTNMALVYLAAGTNVPLGPQANMDDHMGLGIEGGLALILTRETGGATHIEHLRLPRLTSLALSFLLESVSERETNRNTNKKDLRIPVKLEHTIAKLGEMGLNELAQALHEKGIRQVTFVLYSSLGLFPLHAAQVTLQNGETHYFDELFEVNIAPSAYAAMQARQRVAAAQTVAQELKTVFSAGNPKPAPIEDFLPYAQQEALRIHNIATEHGYQTHYLRPKEITKEQVLHALQREKNSPAGHMYAHLAIHGTYQPDDLRNSRLILAGVDKPMKQHCILLGEVLDGTIDLSGIRLLVLSACQTSVIDIQQVPNEVVGLASAFLQAGVTGVIASLWKVDDWATYLLMTHFAQLYLGSHGTLSPAQALIMAQRWLREEATYQAIVNLNPLKLSASTDEATRRNLKAFQEKAKETPEDLPFAHPKYWAAFIVTGY